MGQLYSYLGAKERATIMLMLRVFGKGVGGVDVIDVRTGARIGGKDNYGTYSNGV
ncbi:hypothetical protein ABAC402_11165 [Asticcacaulis sp. AC402]|nr:hypothetical protein ABAC402_11165 [Asticcacaulis sp. AC402]